MKFIIIKNFITHNMCNKIIKEFNEPDNPVDIGLLDGDLGNKLYKSKRSNELYFKYIVNNCSTQEIYIINKLFNITNLDFSNSINSKALPVFKYKTNGLIEPHRGVQKESNLLEYQEYVCVIMLSQINKDYTGGYFYLNTEGDCSLDGKVVTNENIQKRFYPHLNKGDMILFHNPSFIHGVTEVKSGTRYTCSFRTNDKNQL